jgi:hypothetical protein
MVQGKDSRKGKFNETVDLLAPYSTYTYAHTRYTLVHVYTNEHMNTRTHVYTNLPMDSSLMAETHFLFSKGSAPVVTPKKDEGGGR